MARRMSVLSNLFLSMSAEHGTFETSPDSCNLGVRDVYGLQNDRTNGFQTRSPRES